MLGSLLPSSHTCYMKQICNYKSYMSLFWLIFFWFTSSEYIFKLCRDRSEFDSYHNTRKGKIREQYLSKLFEITVKEAWIPSQQTIKTQ